MNQKRVLLVSPIFHGYHLAVSRALESLGYEVCTHVYDEAKTLFARAQNRFAISGSETIKRVIANRCSERAIDALRQLKPDLVLVIKGESLDSRWWEAVQSAGVPNILWIYDELKNSAVDLKLLGNLDAVACYNSVDTKYLNANGVNAEFVPAGFDSLQSFQINNLSRGKVSFIGARYSEREVLLSKLSSAGLDVVAFGREWSRHPYDVIRTGNFRAPTFATGRDLTRQQSYGMMQGSSATINNHGTHKGFNFRTFEAGGVGAIQLIDRADVSDFYEPDKEVLVYSSPQDIVAFAERLSGDEHFSREMRNAAQSRTLNEHTIKHRMVSMERLWQQSK
ncbi:MAG: hypothetical protein RL196_1526 [Actinomycetota bacterium]|jgi:spore maturation protein CgeB